VGSKSLLQENPPVLSWGYQLMQVVLFNGCKMVIVVVIQVSFLPVAETSFFLILISAKNEHFSYCDLEL